MEIHNGQISLNLMCPCNQKLYKTTASLKAHHKTQGHVFWESSKEQKDHLIKINRLEIEVTHLRRLNMLLMERITSLTENVNRT